MYFTSRGVTAETSDLDSPIELATHGLGLAVLPRSGIGAADLAILNIDRPQLQRRTALS